jgi:hypothetical protein
MTPPLTGVDALDLWLDGYLAGAEMKFYITVGFVAAALIIGLLVGALLY